MEQEMITITLKEYNQLLEESAWLSCLEQAGVDNWSGIDEAIQILNELEEEE